MVSTIPTWSLKSIRIPHRFVVPTLLGVGLLAAFASTAPWPTLTLIGVLYVGSIPLTLRAAGRLRRAGEPRKAAEAPALLSAPPPTPALGGTTAPPHEWRH
jgi:CDP-diacylglycerol--serine O-phosphatidyltransferase